MDNILDLILLDKMLTAYKAKEMTMMKAGLKQATVELVKQKGEDIRYANINVETGEVKTKLVFPDDFIKGKV